MNMFKKLFKLMASSFLLLSSCNNYLDLKPDAKMVIPKTLEDCELLLNDYSTMNTKYPTYGEVAADNYYLTSSSWKGIADIDERNVYIWSDEPIVSTNQWQGPYKAIYQANQVLSVLAEITDRSGDRWKVCNANALFFRAFAMHQLMNVFTAPYDKKTANEALGLPIKLSPNLDERSVRASLNETCLQIIKDYTIAAHDLPAQAENKGLPRRAAAYAGLARLYLGMQDNERAFQYADSALALQPALLDYNMLNANATLPFSRFNAEVLFSATSSSSYALGQSYALVDTALFRSYATNDLRRGLFFRQTGNGMVFKGSYDNSLSGIFVGLTTAEMYLTRAEAAARLGKLEAATEDLNTFRSLRYKAASINRFESTDATALLKEVLLERRKELIFRGLRWADLKRLNQEENSAQTLTRMIDDKSYMLKPNSKKYAILIPQVAIQESDMKQNARD